MKKPIAIESFRALAAHQKKEFSESEPNPHSVLLLETFERLYELLQLDLDPDIRSQRLIELAETLNTYYASLRPNDVLEHFDSWTEGMSDRAKQKIEELLTALNEAGDFTLAEWHQGMQSLSLFSLSVIHSEKFNEKYARELAPARAIRENNIHLFGVPSITEIPFFKNLRDGWRIGFNQLDEATQQASALQFIYHVENPFIEKNQLTTLLTSELFAEWSGWNHPKKTIVESKEATLEKIQNGLTEISLCSLSAHSAWAYIDSGDAQAFIDYLLRLDNRNNALLLFNDLLTLAQRGVLIYPPQLYTIFSFQLPDHLREDGDSIAAILDTIYRSGQTLGEYCPSLNYSISGKQRGDEYNQHLELLTEGLDTSGVYLSMCSGPPPETLTKATNFGWQGPVLTVDAMSQDQLVTRSLLVENELRPNQTPIRNGDLEKIVESYPTIYFTENGVWKNHIQATLPDSKVGDFARSMGEVTCITNQRGSMLYMSGGEQLQQIENDIATLSMNPGSLYILTRGVKDTRLIVDIGMKRAPNGKMIVIFIDRSDGAYPHSNYMDSFVSHMFDQAKIRENHEHGLIAPDPERITGEQILEKIFTASEIRGSHGELIERMERAIRNLITTRRGSNEGWKQYILLSSPEIRLLMERVLNEKGFLTSAAISLRDEQPITSIFYEKENLEFRASKIYKALNISEQRQPHEPLLVYAMRNRDSLLQTMIAITSDYIFRIMQQDRNIQTLIAEHDRFTQKNIINISLYFATTTLGIKNPEWVGST